MNSRSVAPAVRAGGWSLILAALLFLGVFSYLAAKFEYPDVLDRPAGEVLPRLLALGATGRAVWVLYGLVPLLLIPAGIGAEAALRRAAPGATRAASHFATLGAFSMLLGLMRWPSIQWELGRTWADADGSQRATLGAVFSGLNSYLGNFIGEFVGELFLNLFFALTAYAMLRSTDRPRWAGISGLVVSAIGFIAMFRNATGAVAPIAAANNLVLPIWLIVLGWLLLRATPGEEVNDR
ncbi:MAG TPA: DUF4386 domain-containing protein [Thermoanaerobaculia bacterium]|nr:DUF4386 domain-containing protein [Thermoanaerobaculia bacterium]